MYHVNRIAVILKPKQPYADWANSLPDTGGHLLDLANSDIERTVYLVPSFTYTREAATFVRKICKELFEEELFAWCTDPNLWPKKRDWATFQLWFDVEIDSVVIDLLNEEIEKEEM